jgi:hypothetical protein
VDFRGLAGIPHRPTCPPWTVPRPATGNHRRSGQSGRAGSSRGRTWRRAAPVDKAPPRTDATGDTTIRRIESEAVAIVHAPTLVFCSKFVKSPMRRVAAASDSVRRSFVNIACRSARDQDCACIHTGRALLPFRTVRHRDHQTCGLSVIATPAEWFPIPMR